MDTKSKSFKYSIVLKTIAFIIILASVCIGLFEFCQFFSNYEKSRHYEPTIGKDIFSSNSLRSNVSWIEDDIMKLGVFYKSEENIKKGNTITAERILNETKDFYNRYYSDFIRSGYATPNKDNSSEEYNLSQSMLTLSKNELGEIIASFDTTMMLPQQVQFHRFYEKELAAIPSTLIANDFADFSILEKRVQALNGIDYYIEKDGDIFANISKPNQKDFKNYDVYSTIERGAYSLHLGSSNVNSGWETIYEAGNMKIDDCAYIIFTGKYLKPLIDAQAENRQITISLISYASIIVICVLLCLIYLIITTGKTAKNSEVQLNWLDRIYTEINLASIIGAVILYIGGMYFLISEHALEFIIPITAIAGFVSLGLFLSLVRKIKAKKFVDTTISFRLVRGVWRKIKQIFENVKEAFNGGKITTRAVWITVGFGALCCATIFFFPIAIVLIIGVAVIVAHNAKAYEAIAEGAQQLRSGNLDYKIDTQNTKSIFAPLATDINSVADGLHAAVENELKSERMKSELITNVSHDIRTPLTSIITYVDLIKKEGLQSENCNHYFEIIEQKSQRLKTLTDDLFEVSKAASGNIAVEIENVDLTSLIKQGMGELDDKITSSGLDFKLNMPETQVMVRADGKLLWRVIENLLSNVFKYALEHSRVYISVTKDEATASFIMKNISASELNVSSDELTERFKRGDDARQSEGSGLGLAIAKNLVELQQGKFTITVDGDLFKAKVTLPLA